MGCTCRLACLEPVIAKPQVEMLTLLAAITGSIKTTLVPLYILGETVFQSLSADCGCKHFSWNVGCYRVINSQWRGTGEHLFTLQPGYSDILHEEPIAQNKDGRMVSIPAH